MDFTERAGGGLPLSLLSVDFGPSDFNYIDFTQPDDEIDYLAEDSSASNPASSSAPTATAATGTGSRLGLASAALPATPSTDTAPTSEPQGSSSSSSPGGGCGNASWGTSRSSPPKQQRRLERRGHTKSRRGCFNCKRRRIKCQENRPACGHCVKTGLTCEYPTAPQVVSQPQHQIPLFSLQDMRLFQHFLFKCYPHQPLGNDSIWTHEIPCLSQEHDYLMHAVLGLAASDLMQADPSLVEAAMWHRLKAIKAVKKALADSPRRPPQQTGGPVSDTSGSFTNEGNALMATCYALTFQSVMLDDGMAEYMTFIRGIVIVAVQMYKKGARFLFSNFFEHEQNALLKPLMDELPPINRAWAEGAVAAVDGLAALVAREGDEVAAEYHGLLASMAEQMLVSPFGAYQAVSRHYGWWMQMPHDRFRAVVDPGSQVFVLLASHWIAVKMVMRPVTEVEMRVSRAKQREVGAGARRKGHEGRGDGIARWLRHLNGLVAPEYRAYNSWPVWVEEQMTADPGFFGAAVGC